MGSRSSTAAKKPIVKMEKKEMTTVAGGMTQKLCAIPLQRRNCKLIVINCSFNEIRMGNVLQYRVPATLRFPIMHIINAKRLPLRRIKGVGIQAARISQPNKPHKNLDTKNPALRVHQLLSLIDLPWHQWSSDLKPVSNSGNVQPAIR